MLKDTKRKISLILVSVLLIIVAPLYLGCETPTTNTELQFAEGEELTIYFGQTYEFEITGTLGKEGIISLGASSVSVTIADPTNRTISGSLLGTSTVKLSDGRSGIVVDTITVHVINPPQEDLFEQYPNFPTSISVEVGQTNTEISAALPSNEKNALSVIDESIATVSENGTVTGVAKGLTAVEVIVYNSADLSICYAAEITVEVTEPETAGQDTEDEDEDEDDTPTEGTTETTGNNIVYLGSYSGTTTVQNSVALQAYDGLFTTNNIPRVLAPSELSFSSNDSSIATVNSNGIITGVSAGTTTINVTKGSFADSNPITRYRITVLDLSEVTMNMPNYVNVYLDNPGYQYPLTINELGSYRVSGVTAYNNPGTTGAITGLSITDNVGRQLLSFTATNVGEVMIQFNLSLSGTNISIPHHMIVNVYNAPPVQPSTTPSPEEDDAMTPEDMP